MSEQSRPAATGSVRGPGVVSNADSAAQLCYRLGAVRLVVHAFQRFMIVPAIAAIASSGCAPKLRPLFQPPDPPIVWPPPPFSPKVRFLGSLRTSADLKPPTKPLQAISEALLGKPEPARLFGPRKAVCTADGRYLWVADPGGRCVHLMDLKRRTYRKISKVGDAEFLNPVDLCLGPSGSVYVCDSETAAIYRLSAVNGALPTEIRTTAELLRPVALTYDPATHELYVVDVLAHDVKVLSPDGALLRLFGGRGRDPGKFNYPTAIAHDADRIWVADSGNNRVQALTPDGHPLATLGQAGDAPGDLALPKGVALDSDGHVYVVDARFENVQIFDRDGRLLLFFGEEGIGPGEFWLPAGIFIDAQDRVWVCDSYNRRVQVFQYLRTTEPASAGSDSRS